MRPLITRYLLNPSQTGYGFERSVRSSLPRVLGRYNIPAAVYVDLGCGHKPFADVFRAFAGSYVGVDVYPGEHVDVVYDGTRLPFDDASVDVVFASSVFEHVAQIDTTLAEIARVLKPSGTLLALTPFMSHVHGTPFDYHRPTRYGWDVLIDRAFGANAVRTITATDTRCACLMNLVTSYMSVRLLGVLRAAYDWAARSRAFVGIGGSPSAVADPSSARTLELGDASAETRSGSVLVRAAYVIVQLNPFSIVLGWAGFIAGMLAGLFGSSSDRYEGEITSGYCVEVRR